MRVARKMRRYLITAKAWREIGYVRDYFSESLISAHTLQDALQVYEIRHKQRFNVGCEFSDVQPLTERMYNILSGHFPEGSFTDGRQITSKMWQVIDANT